MEERYPCGIFKGLEDDIVGIVDTLPDDYLEQIQSKIDEGADIHAIAWEDSFRKYYLLQLLIQICDPYQQPEPDSLSGSNSDAPKNEDAVLKLVELFLKNGFDPKRNNGEAGAACLAVCTIAYGSFNRYMPEVVKLLLAHGADSNRGIDFWEAGEVESPLGIIRGECQGLSYSMCDYYGSNLMEVVIEIIKAKNDGLDFHAINSFEFCYGSAINRVWLVGPNLGDASIVDGMDREKCFRFKKEEKCGFVFEIGDRKIFLSNWSEIYEDPHPFLCDENCKTDVTDIFAPWHGDAVKYISLLCEVYEIGKIIKISFESKEPLYVIPVEHHEKEGEVVDTDFIVMQGDQAYDRYLSTMPH